MDGDEHELRGGEVMFGAKTMALDAKTHNLLVDALHFETKAADGKQKAPQR